MPSGDSKEPSRQPSTAGIRTLSDLNRPSDSDSDSDNNNNNPQEYYTGGENSGMLVQDPSKQHDVDSIFDRARQMGATQGPLESILPSSSSRSFTGTGRTLAGETVPAPASQPPESIVHNIIFWRNGFTVNDGPLRRLDDPENAPFLESIAMSECPRELAPADTRSQVHCHLIRRDENFTEPEKPQVPFQGVGRTLGSSSTPATSEPSASAPVNTQTPSTGLLDESLPSTSLQLRLADGTRMVAHFNYHHTVADIRAFIDASRPSAASAYQLQTVGFPPKMLSDPTQTIEQAGLANSVVIQKL